MNENRTGICRDTEIEKVVDANFRGECSEVGMYLAMARQAQREGLPEVAEALRTIALEEAEHAARFAELNGVIRDNLKENIEMMLEGEEAASREKGEAALRATECGVDEACDFFHESSRDEGRHARMLRGILERYFKG
ncbi:ferritin family protein [Methanothermobacter sp. KEPCO 2]|uniref:ferritin-like domain-containing protein n=1 Tax=Methanothermobacter sp. KEPCO 2 TaxID=3240977 RepID=UPI003511D89E